MTNFWTSLPWYIAGTICTVLTHSLLEHFKERAEKRQAEENSTEAPWHHEADDWLDEEDGIVRIKITHAQVKPSESLINFIFYSISVFVYYSSIADGPTWNTAIFIAGAWCVLTIALEFLCWIVLHFVGGLTFYAAYIEDQPWLALNYLAVYLSPLVAFALYILI